MRKFKRNVVSGKLNDFILNELLAGIEQRNDSDFSVDFGDIKFAGFDNVVVVGPQRSGTTFFAQVLATQLGYKYVDEIEFLVNDEYLFKKYLEVPGSVIQAPAMTHMVHKLVSDSVLVVYMRRATADILRSLVRKNGFLTPQVFAKNQVKVLRHRYAEHPCIKEILDEIHSDEIYIDIMYKIWRNCQIKAIKNYVELNYESLKDHPLWLDKAMRRDFHPKQTSVQPR